MLALLLVAGGCATDTRQATATDRDQRRELRQDRREARQEARREARRQARREARQQTRQQEQRAAALEPTPTTVVVPPPEPSTPPAGSAEEYWADIANSSGEDRRTVQHALDNGALTYPVHRFVNPAGDLYCNLDSRGAPPGCELVGSVLPEPEWCGSEQESSPGIRFEGPNPVPLCSDERLRRPGALVVPVGGIADSSVLRCLVEAHGVTCVHRDPDAGAFSLHADERSMQGASISSRG